MKATNKQGIVKDHDLDTEMICAIPIFNITHLRCMQLQLN